MSTGFSAVLVDDDPGSLQILRMLVEQLGGRPAALDRPRLALERVECEPPELLITDLRMPEMSGLELLRAVRARLPELCCLMITGFATDDSVAEAYEAGAYDLLLKPIHLIEAQTRIKNAVEAVRLRREVRALRAMLLQPPAAEERTPMATRAQELAELPALPGLAAPVRLCRREEIAARLERLGQLLHQGYLTAAEFEEKKRALLQQL